MQLIIFNWPNVLETGQTAEVTWDVHPSRSVKVNFSWRWVVAMVFSSSQIHVDAFTSLTTRKKTEFREPQTLYIFFGNCPPSAAFQERCATSAVKQSTWLISPAWWTAGMNLYGNEHIQKKVGLLPHSHIRCSKCKAPLEGFMLCVRVSNAHTRTYTHSGTLKYQHELFHQVEHKLHQWWMCNISSSQIKCPKGLSLPDGKQATK